MVCELEAVRHPLDLARASDTLSQRRNHDGGAMTTESKLPSIANALLILVVLLPGLLGHDYPEPLRSYFLLAGIMLIGILFSFPLYAFLYGLAGGWDDDTLAELGESAGLSSFMRPLAWLFWKCCSASTVVGTSTATCFPYSIALNAARMASSVLP